jgi:deoxyribonuclease V
MQFKNIHPWGLSPAKAIQLQNKLKRKIKLTKCSITPKLIAGADVTFKKGKAIGVVVIMSVSHDSVMLWKVIECVRKIAKISYPYIPGLLTFREGPVLERCFRVLKKEPDVIIFDGQGLAHPRNMGIATHLGILLDKPTIGCAKTWLYGKYNEPGKESGAFSYLFDQKKNKIGAVLRTRSNVKPVYVSVGNKIDLDSCIKIILMCTEKYRIPQAMRLAHYFSNQGV